MSWRRISRSRFRETPQPPRLKKVCNDGHRFGKRSLGDNVDTADAEMSIFNDGDTSGKLERFLEGRSLRLNLLKSSVAANLTSLHLD